MVDCKLFVSRRVKHIAPIEIDTASHVNDELTYFIFGSGTTQIRDCVYSYSPKSFAFYKKGTPHNEINLQPCDIIWTHFSYNLKGIELKEGVFDDPDSKLLDILQKLRRLDMENDEGAEVIKEACLAELVVTAYRLQQKNSRADGDSMLDGVLEYIDENKNCDIDFSQLASSYNYSYDRFRHIFASRFGMSPYAYLLEQRIEQASYLLENTRLSLTEIAYNTGFNSLSGFANAFKKHRGITPSEWRKNRNF